MAGDAIYEGVEPNVEIRLDQPVLLRVSELVLLLVYVRST